VPLQFGKAPLELLQAFLEVFCQAAEVLQERLPMMKPLVTTIGDY
jgi:hypothetical protein